MHRKSIEHPGFLLKDPRNVFLAPIDGEDSGDKADSKSNSANLRLHSDSVSVKEGCLIRVRNIYVQLPR